MPSLLAIKTVLRCRDFEASRNFYETVLALPIIEEWEETIGRGAIFAVGPDRGAVFEIYQMRDNDPRYDAAFDERVANDKLDVQLHTDSVDAWVERLTGRWPFDGPQRTAWGHRWIKLRDPDGLLVAIWEDVSR